MNKLAPYIDEIIPFLTCLKIKEVKIPKFLLFEIFWNLDTKSDPKNLTSKDIDIIIAHYRPHFSFMIFKHCDLNQIKRIKFLSIRQSLYVTEDLEVMKYYVENIVLKSRPSFSLTYNDFEYLTDNIRNLKIHEYLLDFVKTRAPTFYYFEENYEKKNYYHCCFWIKCGVDIRMLKADKNSDLYKKLLKYSFSI